MKDNKVFDIATKMVRQQGASFLKDRLDLAEAELRGANRMRQIAEFDAQGNQTLAAEALVHIRCLLQQPTDHEIALVLDWMQDLYATNAWDESIDIEAMK